MVVKHLVLILIFMLPLISCEKTLSLPKLYEMEDPNECAERDDIFCKVTVILRPYNNTINSTVWNIIQSANHDYRYFQRNKLLHGRCFKKKEAESVEDILSNEYALRYRNYSLTGIVQNISCFKKGRLILNDLDKLDITLVLFGAIFGIFFVLITIYTFLIGNEFDNKIIQKMTSFSLINICKELQSTNKNDDFKKLKSIQGIRTMTMMLIISAHAFYGNMFLFLKNPEYIENIYVNLISRSIVTVCSFLVQTFFLISAWLLSVQLIKIIKDHEKLTVRHVMIILLNRYFRLIPVILVSIAVHRTNFAYDLISYINEDIMKREVDNCRYYWWKNIIFVQNFYESEKICSPVTWYVATDYQLYSLTVVLFYVSQKLGINRKYLIAFVVMISVIIQVIIISTTEFQGFIRLFPKTANLHDELVSKSFTISYLPIWCNTATYMLGVIFGTIYSKRKQEKLFSDNFKNSIWLLSFVGLPILAVFMTSFQYETRFFEILISVFARPIFSAGIGLGILGMATGTGGVLKLLFESWPLVYLANFCYCVYLFHDVVVFLRIFRVHTMVQLSTMYIVKYTFTDYVISFVIGALIHITVELPLIRIQKLILPQLSKSRKNEDN